MKLKLYLQNSADSKAFSILELLVSTSVSMLITAAALSSLIAHKRFYTEEVARAKTNQDLRSVFDIISSEIRLSGENLSETFPAILLTNGSSGAPDLLTVRRNLSDEVLKLCNKINAASTTTNVKFSQNNTVANPNPPACGFNVNADNYTSWYNFLQSQENQTAKVYMYNQQNKKGEFFEIDKVKQTSTHYRLEKSSLDPWVNTYKKSNGWIYQLEEWQLTLDGDILKLIQGGDPSNFINLANDISDFQVRIKMQDGSTKTKFTKNNNWKEIEAVEITISSEEQVGDKIVSRSWTSQLLPRNVISSG